MQPTPATGPGIALSDVPRSASEPARRAQVLVGVDRWMLRLLVLWSGLVTAVVGVVIVREASTLGYPVARILFEDQFFSIGDGHLIPRNGEVVTRAFAALFMAPLYWLRAMAYFPLANLVGSVHAITLERLTELILYLLGTPLVYRLLRHGKADRWVAFVLAAAYAISPVVLSRILLCISLPAAQFLLWSELGRIEGRPHVRAIGLVAATFSYPLTGFSAVLLALQDYLYSMGPQRRTNLRILVVTAAALAIVHFGVLGLWNRGHPDGDEFHVGLRTFNEMLGYRVFPFPVAPFLAEPLKLFEIAVFMAGSCVFLLTRPGALVPAVVDLIYYAFTNEGTRDHSMVLSTIGLFTILGVRASLFKGGTPRRNRALVGGALLATVCGYAMAGPNGLIALALAPDPPHPHLADIGPCVPPGQQHCVVLPSLYPGFVGRCEQLTTYQPADLEDLRIEDTSTAVFVAPSRLVNDDQKGGSYEGLSNEKILGALAAKIRSGQLHASVCSPWFVLVRSPNAAPNDPSAADRLEHPAP